MKTEIGRELAKELTQRLRIFKAGGKARTRDFHEAGSPHKRVALWIRNSPAHADGHSLIGL